MEPKTAYQKLMEKVDQEVPSPEYRATQVLNILRENIPNLTDWDLICFCTEYLAQQSLVLHAIKPPVKQLVGLIYTMHYIVQSEGTRATGLAENNAQSIEGSSNISNAGSSGVSESIESDKTGS